MAPGPLPAYLTSMKACGARLMGHISARSGQRPAGLAPAQHRMPQACAVPSKHRRGQRSAFCPSPPWRRVLSWPANVRALRTCLELRRQPDVDGQAIVAHNLLALAKQPAAGTTGESKQAGVARWPAYMPGPARCAEMPCAPCCWLPLPNAVCSLLLVPTGHAWLAACPSLATQVGSTDVGLQAPPPPTRSTAPHWCVISGGKCPFSSSTMAPVSGSLDSRWKVTASSPLTASAPGPSTRGRLAKGSIAPAAQGQELCSQLNCVLVYELQVAWSMQARTD